MSTKPRSKTPARTPQRKRKKRGARAHPWRRRILLGALGIVGGFLLLFLLTYAFVHVPEPNEIATAQSVEVIDRDGEPLGSIHSEADRVIIPLAEMPRALREAVVATEDRAFYRHKGISPLSILRAAFANVRSGGVAQGGSTITQQYVKNAFVGNERSIWRKVKEAAIAVKLEQQKTKDEILEAYLNTIYFGRGTYGVEAAARTYFGRRARDLSLPQAALLAGMIQAPERYDPARDPRAARGRRDAVLSFMARDGYLTPLEAERAKRARTKVRPRRAGGIAPHFLDDLRKQLEEEIGPQRLYGGGVVVRATLDLDMQQAAEAAVRAVYDRRGDPEAALVAIDPTTGAVRAMVGARNYARRQLNLASRGHRQPGSTFKTAVLATAVREGIPLTETYRAPGTITIPTDSKPWTVGNYDLRDRGTLTIRQATELSVNTVYAQLIMDADPADVVETAHLMGIESALDAIPSLALGTEEVTPQELTSMFATLAARGTYHTPTLVEEVTANGETILRFEADPERALERDVADTVNVALQGVIERGTGASANIGRPAAGKTGTTERLRDAWFAGYTPDLAAVVWNGYPARNKPMTNVRGIRVVGGSFPAQIWRAFMLEALADTPATAFAPLPRREPRPQVTVTPSPTATDATTLPSPTSSPSETPSATPSPTQTKTKAPPPKESPTPSPTPTSSGG